MLFHQSFEGVSGDGEKPDGAELCAADERRWLWVDL